MKFTAILALAATAVALPNFAPNAGQPGDMTSSQNMDYGHNPWPIPNHVTIQQAQAKCGNHATLSCCDKATYAGKSTEFNSGLLGGALSGLIAQGAGSSGLGLFNGCSPLAGLPIVNIAQVTDLVNRKCQNSVACCDYTAQHQNGLLNVGVPCLALGSIL